MTQGTRIGKRGQQVEAFVKAHCRERAVVLVLVVVVALVLQGCFGRVQYIAPSTFNAPLRQPVTFEVWGVDTCTTLSVDFGDGGQPVPFSNVNFGASGAARPFPVTHTYSYWGGLKTLTAEGVTNCTGKAQAKVSVLPDVFTLGFGQPVPSACTPVPNVPRLRRNTVVRLSDVSSPSNPARINFGCLLSGCIYSADGQNAPAPPGFPFPALNKYSLVIRVGTQVVQGGTNVTFTTTQAGPMEVCLNDDILPDNTGAWGIGILVDESNAR
ncbi:MAG TPA: hypothetical protein VJA45_02810 [Methylomirabilota bacterium]|nr:hypothetical protein [Methylomirabilota bacterium]